MLKYAEKRKILIFHKYFLNMDISLIMRLQLYALKIVIHLLRIHLEGNMSQDFDIGLSFNLVAFRKGDHKSYPVFCSKI